MLPLDLHAVDDFPSIWFHRKLPQRSSCRSRPAKSLSNGTRPSRHRVPISDNGWFDLMANKIRWHATLRRPSRRWVETCAAEAKWGHREVSRCNDEQHEEIWTRVGPGALSTAGKKKFKSRKAAISSCLWCVEPQNLFRYKPFRLWGDKWEGRGKNGGIFQLQKLYLFPNYRNW